MTLQEWNNDVERFIDILTEKFRISDTSDKQSINLIHTIFNIICEYSNKKFSLYVQSLQILCVQGHLVATVEEFLEQIYT